MSHLVISKKNEVYLQIEIEPHIYHELRDAFQFKVPNAKFSPAYNRQEVGRENREKGSKNVENSRLTRSSTIRKAFQAAGD